MNGKQSLTRDIYNQSVRDTGKACCLEAIPALLIVLVGLVLTTFLFPWRLFAKASGWTALANRYGTPRKPPPGNSFTWKTIAVGAVRYRNCVTVACLPEGLFLSIWANPALRIPWDEIKSVRRTLLFLRDARQLSIGDPQIGTITFFTGFYEKVIQPCLKPRSLP